MPASPGRIWRNIMIFGGQSGEATMTPPGDIRAYDVLTGKLLWQFHTDPAAGRVRLRDEPARRLEIHRRREQLGRDVDRRGPRHRLHPDRVGHGRLLRRRSPRPEPVRELPARARRSQTGKRLWHFQTIHHDLWDLDNVSAPQLVTVTHNGKNVDVVAHAGKTGFLYVFNRVTGEPIWPIEERKVDDRARCRPSGTRRRSRSRPSPRRSRGSRSRRTT